MLDPRPLEPTGLENLVGHPDLCISKLMEIGSSEVYAGLEGRYVERTAVSPEYVAARLGRSELTMPLVLEVSSPHCQIGYEVDGHIFTGNLTQEAIDFDELRESDSHLADGETGDMLVNSSFGSDSRKDYELDPFALDPKCVVLAPFGGKRCCVAFDLVVPQLQRYLLDRRLEVRSEQSSTRWRNCSFDPTESLRLLETLNVGPNEQVDLYCLDGNSFGSLNKSANPVKVTHWILGLVDCIPNHIREALVSIRKAGDEFILVFKHHPDNAQRFETVLRSFIENVQSHFIECELERARDIASFKFRAAQFEKRVRQELATRGREVTLENFLEVGLLLLEDESPASFSDKLDEQAFTILKRSFECSPSQQVYPAHLQSGEFLANFFSCSGRDRSELPANFFPSYAIQAVRDSADLVEFRRNLEKMGGVGAELAQDEISLSYRTRALLTLLPETEVEEESLNLFGPGTFTCVKATISAEELIKAGKVQIARLFEEVDRIKREGRKNFGSLDISAHHLNAPEPYIEVSLDQEDPVSKAYGADSMLASYLFELESSLDGARTGIKGLARSAQLSAPLWLYFPVVLDPNRLGYTGPNLLFATRMIDISNFGAFNQRFGHNDADQILAQLHRNALNLFPTALCTITKGGRLAISWVLDSDPDDEIHDVIDRQMDQFYARAKSYLRRLVDSDPELQVIGCIRSAVDDYLRERKFPLGVQDSFLGNANMNSQHTIRLTPEHCGVKLSELIYPDTAGV